MHTKSIGKEHYYHETTEKNLSHPIYLVLLWGLRLER